MTGTTTPLSNPQALARHRYDPSFDRPSKSVITSIVVVSSTIITRIFLGRFLESNNHVKDAGTLLVQVMLALSPGDRLSSLTDTRGVVNITVGEGMHVAVLVLVCTSIDVLILELDSLVVDSTLEDIGLVMVESLTDSLVDNMSEDVAMDAVVVADSITDSPAEVIMADSLVESMSESDKTTAGLVIEPVVNSMSVVDSSVSSAPVLVDNTGIDSIKLVLVLAMFDVRTVDVTMMMELSEIFL